MEKFNTISILEVENGELPLTKSFLNDYGYQEVKNIVGTDYYICLALEEDIGGSEDYKEIEVYKIPLANYHIKNLDKFTLVDACIKYDMKKDNSLLRELQRKYINMENSKLLELYLKKDGALYGNSNI